MNKRKESFQGMALSPIFIISVPPMYVGGVEGLGSGEGGRKKEVMCVDERRGCFLRKKEEGGGEG